MTSAQYAAVHKEMVQQRAERRWLDRPLRAGDLVQAHTGGDIREVVAVFNAGDCLEALADVRAREARAPKRDE